MVCHFFAFRGLAAARTTRRRRVLDMVPMLDVVLCQAGAEALPDLAESGLEVSCSDMMEWC
jgi:hypothetical protein